MVDIELDPPARIFGRTFGLFSEITYYVRQYAIRASDDEAISLVRAARDAETPWQASLAARRMQHWIDAKQRVFLLDEDDFPTTIRDGVAPQPKTFFDFIHSRW